MVSMWFFGDMVFNFPDARVYGSGLWSIPIEVSDFRELVQRHGCAVKRGVYE